MKFRFLGALIVGLMISCSTAQAPVVVADNYDEDKDITTLTIMPYGNIHIPGEWTKTNYNEVSRQYYFSDEDATSIAITKNPQKDYPFYQKRFTDIEFAQSFYKWEKEHYEKQGYEMNEKAVGENYVIWTVMGENVNSIFLYGAKNDYAYNFSVLSDNWTEAKRAEFLENLFEKN